MKKITLVLTISLSILTLSVSSGIAEGDRIGEIKAKKLCGSCHGARGYSRNNQPEFPRLAGQHQRYLVKQLEDFRDGTRKDPVMSSLAKTLSDADIKEISAYFSMQREVYCW